MDVLTAARKLYRTFGIAACAELLDKSKTTIQHEISATPGTAKIGLADAVLVSAESGDLGILNAFALEMNCMVTSLPNLDEGRPGRNELCEMVRNVGRYCAEAAATLEDERVNDNELHRCTEVVGEAMKSIQKVQSMLTALNRAGKPVACAPRAIREVA